LPFIFLNSFNLHALFSQVHFPGWNVANYFRSAFSSPEGNMSYILPNILYVLSNFVHPGYVFLGVLFLIFIKKIPLSRAYIRVCLSVIVIYALFLAGLTLQNQRFLMLTFPFVLIFYSGIFIDLAEKMKNSKPALLFLPVALILVIQLALFYRAFRPFYENSRNTRLVAEEMMHYPGRTIYTFNIDMALKAYHVNNEMISIWEKPLEEFKPNSLVLFNYLSFSRQWNGLNPMINWETLNRRYHLTLLETMPGGWNLYEIND
jgi:hypothetical protein